MDAPSFPAMSLDAPTPLSLSGAGLSIGIVASRYNPALVDALVNQVQKRLLAAGVSPSGLPVVRVPGANELPSGVQLLLRQTKLDAVVALGVVIRGGTLHYELVSFAASEGLQRVALDTGVPVIAGVVVAETAAQAEERCGGAIDRGAEFAAAALEMANLKRRLS